LGRLGTIAAVIAAPAEELAAVPGIGKGTAEGIR
jgi:excinuclease UvrABC nuclease subunit